jgi:hypothetical protein
MEAIIILQKMEALQKVSKPEHIFINTNNIIFFVIFYSIISIFQKRMKENQTRFLSMLPLNNVSLAIIRFWSSVIPLIILLIYFIISHFLFLFIWDVYSTIPFIQVGIVLVVLALMISASDSWYSDPNFGIRKENFFFPLVMLIPLFLFLYYSSLFFQKDTSAIIIRFLGIGFFLLGIITMLATILSYQKRKSYLN